MRNEILKLLSSHNKSDNWIGAITTLVESKLSLLLSDTAGSYTAVELLAELKIRASSAARNDIRIHGMTELINNVEHLNNPEIVINYIFKDESKTGIVYLNRAKTRIIGALVIVGRDQ
jgi:hypothetical protein